MLENKGFQPKSEVSEKERQEFARYREELLALPVVNSKNVGAAKQHRSFFAEHFPQLKKTMKELGLDF